MARVKSPPPPAKGTTPGNAGKNYPKRFLAPAEIMKLMNACDLDLHGIRTRALIAFLYRTGMDLSEALNRKLSDLDLETGQESVNVYGRSKREPRRLALDEFAVRELGPWLEARKALPGDHIFCTIQTDRAGNRLSDSPFRDLLHKMAERAGIEGRVTPSAFRNTLAAELLVESWPFHYLQAQFGIKMLYTFQYLVDDLGIRLPSDAEIMELMRTRPPPVEAGPP